MTDMAVAFLALLVVSAAAAQADSSTAPLKAQQTLLRPCILKNANLLEVHIIPVGASIQRISVPDKNGFASDIVLGFDSANTYLEGNAGRFGVIAGRVVNRIANATFTLDGKQYQLKPNEFGNALHGGGLGPAWAQRVYTVQQSTDSAVILNYISPAGDQGFPGTVNATITYRLTDDNELQVLMEATTDAATPLNLAQHTYFNLNGEANGTVLDHYLQLNSTSITVNNNESIPTGAYRNVSGTAYDFTTPRRLGERIAQVPAPNPRLPGGYDLNYVLFNLTGPEAARQTKVCVVSEQPQLAARLYSATTGRAMDLSTNAPGVNLYTGNYLDGTTAGKGSYLYPQHAGVALETQVFPNAINMPEFPQCTLRPGQVYRHIWNVRFYNYTGPSPA